MYDRGLMVPIQEHDTAEFCSTQEHKEEHSFINNFWLKMELKIERQKRKQTAKHLLSR